MSTSYGQLVDQTPSIGATTAARLPISCKYHIGTCVWRLNCIETKDAGPSSGRAFGPCQVQPKQSLAEELKVNDSYFARPWCGREKAD